MRGAALRIGARVVPPLGARAWRLLAGVVAFEVGTGMTLPLVIVYLHESRGIGLAAAGLALSAVGAGGLAGTIVAGPLADRLGAGWVTVGGLGLAGAGKAGYLAVDGVASAIAASAAQGAGFAAVWVGLFPLLVRAVSSELRGDVLATNYGLTNLGLGLGSTLAGGILAFAPNAFTPLFVADAATYLGFAVWLGLGDRAGRRLHEPGRVRLRRQHMGDRRRAAARARVCAHAPPHPRGGGDGDALRALLAHRPRGR